jgi:hypothetical protein
MNRLIQGILFIVTLLLVSCYSKTEQISRKDLVSSKDMVDILTEIHLAGGILNLPGINRRFAFKDSVTNYMDILDRYGYSKAQLDNTMKYYFVKKPKQLQEIYDQVLINLSELETRIDAELPKPEDSVKNLWEGKLSYSLPDDGIKEAVWIDIPVRDTGTYKLTATIQVYTDDQSLDPGINLFFWKPDKTPEGVRDYWERISFLKDGLMHDYSVSKKFTDTTYTRLRGWLLEDKPQPGTWEKHMKAEAIILTMQ